MLLLIDNHDSFTYNLWQWLQADATVPVTVVANNAIGASELDFSLYQGIILSPGPGVATNPKDLGLCLEVLRYCPTNLPLLGVCLGMQAMVAWHSAPKHLLQCPTVTHGKTSAVNRVYDDSWLLADIPTPFTVMRYHSWAVSEQADITPYQITAATDGWVMAIEHQVNPWAGVQFHPESIGSPQGRPLLQNFLQRCGCLAPNNHSGSRPTCVG